MRRSTSKGLTYHISKFRSEREGVPTFNIIIKYRKYCHGIMCKFSWLGLHNKYALHKSQSTARVASGVPGDSWGTSWAWRVPIQTPAGNRHLPSTCYNRCNVGTDDKLRTWRMVETHPTLWGHEFPPSDKPITAITSITWRELMPSDVIRVPVDNVCNVSDFKSYLTQNIPNV